jgi:hypothetical protein
MEALPPEGDEVLAFRVIPLEGPFFILPGFPLSPEARAPEAPPLRIPVNPAPGLPLEAREIPETPVSEPARQSRELPPFPPASAQPDKAPRGSAWSRKIRERSRALWEEGKAVEALAELRRYERDHIAGFTLQGLRRDLERALHLEGEDEIFRHPLLFIPAAILCLILGALSLTIPRRPRGRGVWISRSLYLGFSILALLCLLRLTAIRSLPVYFKGKNPRQALAREAPVYQIPEDRGTRITTLQEGQGLLVYETQDGWTYAESSEGGSAGWIRTGSYLIY